MTIGLRKLAIGAILCALIATGVFQVLELRRIEGILNAHWNPYGFSRVQMAKGYSYDGAATEVWQKTFLHRRSPDEVAMILFEMEKEGKLEGNMSRCRTAAKLICKSPS